MDPTCTLVCPEAMNQNQECSPNDAAVSTCLCAQPTG
jgi:hypothetical protein